MNHISLCIQCGLMHFQVNTSKQSNCPYTPLISHLNSGDYGTYYAQSNHKATRRLMVYKLSAAYWPPALCLSFLLPLPFKPCVSLGRRFLFTSDQWGLQIPYRSLQRISPSIHTEIMKSHRFSQNLLIFDHHKTKVTNRVWRNWDLRFLSTWECWLIPWFSYHFVPLYQVKNVHSHTVDTRHFLPSQDPG